VRGQIAGRSCTRESRVVRLRCCGGRRYWSDRGVADSLLRRQSQRRLAGRAVNASSDRRAVRVADGGCAARHPVRFCRGGFSLPELLIVLAVLSAMAAFVLPSMRGLLDKNRLRSSAISIKAAVSKARSTAIRRGCDVSFRYETGGSRWRIESSCVRFNDSSVTDLEDGGPAPQTTSDGFRRDVPEIIREGRLPQGCQFIERPLESIADSPPLGSDESIDVAGLVEPSAESRQTWSDPITFRPHGRGQDAEILIRGSRDFATSVKLRGLTGRISCSPPFRMATIDPLGVSEEVSD
jgi:prepilin-type N-terminal cleavage/methylation domain-containing protein